jgi:WD40 repeat protein
MEMSLRSFIAPLVIALACATGSVFAAAPLNIAKDKMLDTPGAAVAVTWAADSRTLAAASDFGITLSVWTRKGALLRRIFRASAGPVLGGSIALLDNRQSLLFSPPGNAKSDEALGIWDVTTGKITGALTGPQRGGERRRNVAAHFSLAPDQRFLVAVTAAGKDEGANLVTYDSQRWSQIYASKVVSSSSVCIFGAGSKIAVGATLGGMVTVLQATTGRPLTTFQAYTPSQYGSYSIGALAGSPAGDLILTGIGSGILYGRFLQGPPHEAQQTWEQSMEAAPVRMFRIKDGRQIGILSGAGAPIRQAQWDPLGRFVAVVDNDAQLFLWAPWQADWQLQTALPARALSLSIAPDGSEIAVATDAGVQLYSIH